MGSVVQAVMKKGTPKRFIALAVALLLGLAITPALWAQKSSYRLLRLEGAGELTPESLTTGTTVVVVWASWSPRCRDITERVEALHGRWRDRAKVVTVNFQEKPDVIRKALATKKMPVPVYLDADGAFSKMHAVTTVPHVLVYADGQKVLAQRLTRDIDEVIASKLR